MVSSSHTGGLVSRRIAHFLKPTVASLEDSSLKLPLLSPKSRWPLHLAFNGWQDSLKKWNKWVDEMFPKYHLVWRKVGIIEAILSSKYKFQRNDELIFGVAERWRTETNTFVFPWGEASITLEDMMILGGFSVLGCPVLLPIEGKDSLHIEENLKKELKKLEKIESSTHTRWIDSFLRPGSQFEHEAFLVSWLSRFVFPVDEITKIEKHIILIAIHLAKGTKIALAPAVLASIYRDLSLLKEIMTASSKLEVEEGEDGILKSILWAPFHLVQLWAWERFLPFRPEPKSLTHSEPRTARWHDLQRLKIGNVRPIIDSSAEAFLWRPYCLSIHNWFFPKFYKEREERISIGQHSDEELESFARCLRVCVLIGIDCEEAYYPHRVAMQFGYDQDLPGSVTLSDLSTEVAWFNYCRPLSNEQPMHFPSRMSKADVSINYLYWWRKSVLAPIKSIWARRGRRSLRVARKYFQVPQEIRVLDIDINASIEDNIEGCIVSRQILNEKQIKVEEEDNYPDVPPGFLPKIREAVDLNDLPESLPRNQSLALETSTRHQMIDLNHHPKSPPRIEEAVDLTDLGTCLPRNQSLALESSTRHQMIDLNHLPDSPLNSKIVGAETPENVVGISTHSDERRGKNNFC